LPTQKAPLSVLQQVSLKDRVLQGLSTYLEQEHPVDVVEFFESPDYLGQRLYPRQRLILKIYHRLPLESVPCYLCSTEPAPDPECRWCFGTGLYDEFEDAKELLACRSIYARMYVPELCQHHITGECEREICRSKAKLSDYHILSDQEIRERLLVHGAFILGLVAGRRGTKSFLLSGMYNFSVFELVSDPSPQRTYGLSTSSIISIGNAANEEKQAKVIFDLSKNLMAESPWFQKIHYEPKDIEVDFPGRNIRARCYHANAKSVRGGTNRDIYIDEYLVMAAKDQSEMWRALAYSTATFARSKKRHIVFASSPDLREGIGYEIFEGASLGLRFDTVAFQLAAWEMNPTLTREDFAVDFANDPVGAEIELGAQFADSVRTYIPEDAIEDAVDETLRNRAKPDSKYKYSLHFDNSNKADPAGLVIVHWDPETHDIVTDWVEEWDPKIPDEAITTHGEIDQEKVLKFILDLRDKSGYRFASITTDQFNSAWLMQRLRVEYNDPDGKLAYTIAATQKSNHEAYSTLRNLFVQGAIRIPKHPSLIAQLKSLLLIKKEGSDAWKVEAPARSHDDLADPLGVAAWCALQLATERQSGIHVVESRRTNSHLLPSVDLPQEPGQDAPAHHEECTSRFCHWTCEWHRALMAGTLKPNPQ
jgi:hypothetical protein